MRLHSQSPDISQGVTASDSKEQGASDQGLMFGYATNETEELMPLPIIMAHKLTRKLAVSAQVRCWMDAWEMRFAQYKDGRPESIIAIVGQHAPNITSDEIEKTITEKSDKTCLR